MKLKQIYLLLFSLIVTIIILFFLFVQINATTIDPENTVFKSATEYDYPPFSVITNGQADGFSVELLKAVANEMGIEIEFKIDQWDTIKNELELGELDVLPLVGYSEERDKVFDFTVPYIVMRGNIFVRQDYTQIESENDLFGKEIIVMRGDNSQEYAEKMEFTDKLILVDTYAEAFELLSSGKHDAVLAQSLVGLKLINDLNIKNIIPVTHLSENGVDRIKVSLEGYEQKFSFAVKEGNKDLLAILNEGLAIVSENGTYERLYDKWFPFITEETIDYKRISLYFIGLLLLISISILIFSLSMIKKEVKRKTSEIEDNLRRNTIMFNVMNDNQYSVSDYLDLVLNELIKMTDSKFGYIYLYNEETKLFKLNSWSKDVMKDCQIIEKMTVYQLERTGIWGEVIRQRKPLIVNDFNQDNPYKKGYPEGHIKLTKWMGIPVFFDNKIVATVGLANRQKDYTDNDILQVTTLINGVWNRIERIDYQNKLELEKNKYFSTLISISDGVLIVDINGQIELINKVCAQMTGWSVESAKGVYYKEVFRLTHEDPSKEISDPIEEVLKTGKSREFTNHAILTSLDGTAYMLEDSASPIKNNNNEILGIVVVFRDVTQKMKQLRQIEYISYHDVLTGLYNRRYFEDELRRLDVPIYYPLTVIMADLNGLKLANDAFGHQEGDKLIKLTADILRINLRTKDIAARWGGDEFVVLMPNTTRDEAEEIINRISSSISSKSKNNNSLLSLAFGWETKDDESLEIGLVFKKAEEYMYKRKISNSEGVHGLTIRTIINALFEKSPREEQHSQRVKDLAIKIGVALNLPQHKIDDIASIGLLHDIGKIIIPTELLDKETRLTEEEYNIIKKHPSIGYRMLTATSEFSSIAVGVLNHHERWDGKGYPNGIKGVNIPIESRVIAIADAYDAMISHRPYRKSGLTKEEAKKELIKYSGIQFDPYIISVIVDENII